MTTAATLYVTFVLDSFIKLIKHTHTHIISFSFIKNEFLLFIKKKQTVIFKLQLFGI